MDHIINKIWMYSEAERSDFIEEWYSGQYQKLSDCPNYEAVKAYCKSINALNKYYQTDYKPISPKSIIQDERWLRE